RHGHRQPVQGLPRRGLEEPGRFRFPGPPRLAPGTGRARPVLRHLARRHLRRVGGRAEHARRAAVPPGVLPRRRGLERLLRQPHGQDQLERAVDGPARRRGRPLLARLRRRQCAPAAGRAAADPRRAGQQRGPGLDHAGGRRAGARGQGLRPARVPRRRAQRRPLHRPDRLRPPPPVRLLPAPPAGHRTAPQEPRRHPYDHPMMNARRHPMRNVRRTRRPHLAKLALSLSLALGASLAPAFAQPEPTQAAIAPPANATEAKLRELYNAEWNWRQEEFARERFDGRWQLGSRLPSASAQDWERRAEYWKKVLAELDSIPVDQLGREEQINAAVFHASLEAHLNGAVWRTYEAPFNSDTFFWGGHN